MLRERLPELDEGDVSEDQLRSAREVICVNAVRGARPVVGLGWDSARGSARRRGATLTARAT